MSGTQAAEVTQEPSRIQVVTSENFQEYVAEQLGEPPAPTPEEKAASELAEVEAAKALAKAQEEDPTHDLGEHVPKDKKGKLNERFSELTAARKAAEEKAANLEAQAKTDKEAREAAERTAAELRAKYEPPKEELGPEPQPSQFTDVGEYAKALKDWTTDKTQRDIEAKVAAERQAQEQENAVKAWKDRQKAVAVEIPDYTETIEGSAVKLSEQARDAILESEVGPQLLYHLAKHPEVADHLATLTVGKMLREIGKIEATLSGDKPAPKSEAKQTVAEISKAPAPITPIKGGSTVSSTISANNEFHGTYEEYKAARRAGKIK